MENILNLIIQGVYSDWFFDVFMKQVITGVRNNLELLFVIGYGFTKFTTWTSVKWDDKWAEWFNNFLNKFSRGGTKDEKS